MRIMQPANSGPGEIYPSIVEVPFAGCWHVELAWGPNMDAVDLTCLPVRARSTRDRWARPRANL